MKFLCKQLLSQEVPDANIASDVLDLNQIFKISVQIVVGTGTINGTLALQVSNDESNPSNWSNLGTPPTLNADDTITLIAAQDLCYRWGRILFTDASAGTGDAPLSVNIMAQSV